MTENNARKHQLIKEYEAAPTALQRRLTRLFGMIANDGDKALHNDVAKEIQDMCGSNMKSLLEKVSYAILNVAKKR